MRFFFLFLFFRSLFAAAQTTVVADSIVGRFRINSTILVPGVGKQTIEGEESLDSAQMRERLLVSAFSTHEALYRAEFEVRNLTTQAANLRQEYARFDTAGYYAKAGQLYLPNIIAQYMEVYSGQNTNIEIRENAQKRIVFRRNGTNFIIRMLSSNAFIVLNCYSNATNQKVDVTFIRMNAKQWYGVIDNKSIRLTLR